MVKKGKSKTGIFIIVPILLILIISISAYMKNKGFFNKTDEIDVSNVILNEEFFSSMSEKELIHYKILNSIDYFKNVSGELEKTDVKYGDNLKVNYVIDVENRRGYVHSISEAEDSEIICDNGNQLQIDNVKKSYREFQLEVRPKDETLKKLKPKNRYSEKAGYMVRRDAEYILGADDSVFDQEFSSGELKDYNTWDIKGEENYLGRNCVLIEGNLGSVGKSGDKTFRKLVDKDTGMILKSERLNSKGEVVLSTIVKSLKINENINSKVFEKNLKGYMKIDKVESEDKS
ncbi:hypothetical protein [Clostridium sp. UBA1652]|uniref:hypothetical protein n=1 Tax=Clostridium sp. UBA1652 TaxID=1946348 RepID=UPI002580F181|nr:hypothetical protein [Clostridium sp. UBA1652]